MIIIDNNGDKHLLTPFEEYLYWRCQHWKELEELEGSDEE